MIYQVGAYYEFTDRDGTNYAGTLTDAYGDDFTTLVFDLEDGTDVEKQNDEIVSVTLIKQADVYEEQEYLVKFDMGNPVDVNICVYHENKTELTRSEIIEEAMGYAEEVGITLRESELFEIETLRKR